MRPRRPCSAIFPARPSTTTVCARASFATDGKFFVETDGPDGKLATFEVKYTFGVDPLQQYLIEFPDGRLQALSIAWDTRPKEQGRPALVSPLSERADPARRHPALDQAQPELELHVRRMPFDRRAQELRCGRRSFRDDLGGDQRRLRGLPRPGLRSRCLGAGPAELVAVRKADDPTRAFRSLRRTQRASAGRSIRRPATPRAAVRRHPCARRSRPAASATRAAASSPKIGFRVVGYPTRTAFRRSSRGLYHADGQMLDEVYNYGSFKQSKMFAAGVTCSDCHEPHSAKLRAPGDGVCVQCHAPDNTTAPPITATRA